MEAGTPSRSTEHLVLKLLGHELRQPLANLAVYFRTSSRRAVSPGESSEAEASLRLVDSLLAAFCADTPQEGWRAAETASRIMCEQAGLALDWRAAPDSPRLLAWAAVSLVGNSAKYAAHGVVRVRVQAADGAWVLGVSDMGRGIPADQAAKVLERGFRAGNALDRPGTGTGLWAVSSIVRSAGGAVEVDPGPPSTSIRVLVPAGSGAVF